MKKNSPTMNLVCHAKYKGISVKASKKSLILKCDRQFNGEIHEVMITIRLTDTLIDELRIIKKEHKSTSIDRAEQIVGLVYELLGDENEVKKDVV